MLLGGPVPDWLLSSAVIATVFTVMFHLGMAIVPDDFRQAARRPGLMLKGLFAVLIGVPVLALVVVRCFDLPRPVEIGIMLMAIAPGAPVVLRRTLNAGGDRAFTPALQVAVAGLAIFSMPLWILGLDEVYQSSATVDPRHLARQVLMLQLLPLSLGMLVYHLSPVRAAWISARLGRLASVLLVAVVMLALFASWHLVIGAGWQAVLAIMMLTLLALALGHVLGGPAVATRTSLASVSAGRNPGLALLVAAFNGAAPGVIATILAYMFVSALTAIPYLIWRRRVAAKSGAVVS
jgi:BASS family bile acid:Na+ symporter